MPCLLITLHNGVDLPAANTDGTSDPFIVFNMGESEEKSTVKKKTLNPEWEEDILVNVEDSTEPLLVQVFDWENIGQANFLGRAKVRVDTLVMGRPKSFWLSVGENGKVHVTLTAIGFGVDPLLEGSSAQDCSKKVVVNVVGGENMKIGERMFDALARLTFGTSVKATKVVKKCANPEWNEVYVFNVDDPSKEAVQVELLEKDMFKEKLVGRASIPLGSLTRDRSNPITPKLAAPDGTPFPDGVNKLLINFIPSGFGQEANLAEEYQNEELMKLRRMDTSVALKGARKKVKLRKAKSNCLLKLVVLEANISAGVPMQAIVRIRFEDSNTQTEKDSTEENPFWNENFTFDVDNPKNPKGNWLHMELCDDDRPLGVCKCDVSHLYQGATSDLMLKLATPGKPVAQSTTVKENNANPVWGEQFTFDLGISVNRELEVTVWDKDVSSDELIGTGSLSLSEVLFRDTPTFCSRWVLLKHKGLAAGRLQLQFQCPALGSINNKVVITVEKAEGLLKADLLSESDPFVTLKLMNEVTDYSLHVYITPEGFGRLTAEQRAEKEEQDRVASLARGDITGEIQVKAIAGRDLPAADSNGKSDPFLEMFINANKKDLVRTRVIKKTLEPKWNETLKLKVLDYTQESLTIECYDKDMFRQKLLGTYVWDLHDFEKGKSQGKWVQLREGQGELHLELTPHHFGKVAVPAENPSKIRARVEQRAKELAEQDNEINQSAKSVLFHIRSASKLSPDDVPGEYFVVLKHSSHTYTTQVSPASSEPKWNNVFECVLEGMPQETALFEVFRKPQELVGLFKLPTASLGVGDVTFTADLRLIVKGQEDITESQLMIGYKSIGFGNAHLWTDYLAEEQRHKEALWRVKRERVKQQMAAAFFQERQKLSDEEATQRLKFNTAELQARQNLEQQMLQSAKQAQEATEKRLAAFAASQKNARNRFCQDETDARSLTLEQENAEWTALSTQRQHEYKDAESVWNKRIIRENQARLAVEQAEQQSRTSIEQVYFHDWESIHTTALESQSHLQMLAEERAARKLRVVIHRAVRVTNVGEHETARIRCQLSGNELQTAIKPPLLRKVKYIGSSYVWDETIQFAGLDSTNTLAIELVVGSSDTWHGKASIPLAMLATTETTFWVSLSNEREEVVGFVYIGLTPTKFGSKATARFPNRVMLQVIGLEAVNDYNVMSRLSSNVLVHAHFVDSHEYTRLSEPISGAGDYRWGDFMHLTSPMSMQDLANAGKSQVEFNIREQDANGNVMYTGSVDVYKLQDLNYIRVPMKEADGQDEPCYNLTVLISLVGFPVIQKSLEVEITKASQLRGMSGRAISPFAVLEMDGQKHTSLTLPLSHFSTCTFPEKYHFDIDEVFGERFLRVAICDAEQDGKVLGSCEVSTDQLRRGRSEMLCALFKDEGIAAGQLNLVLVAEGFGLPQRLLEVSVLEGKNFQHDPQFPKLICEATVESSTRTSEPCESTASPVWEDSNFEFSVSDPKKATLRIRVYKVPLNGDIQSGESLGSARVLLNYLYKTVDYLWMPLLVTAGNHFVPSEGEPTIRVKLQPHSFNHDSRRVMVTVLKTEDFSVLDHQRPVVRLKAPTSEVWYSSAPATARLLEWNDKLIVPIDEPVKSRNKSALSMPVSRQNSFNRKGFALSTSLATSILATADSDLSLLVDVIDHSSETVLATSNVILHSLASGENECTVTLSAKDKGNPKKAEEFKGKLKLIVTPVCFGNEQARQYAMLDAARSVIAPRLLEIFVTRSYHLLAAALALRVGEYDSELNGAEFNPTLKCSLIVDGVAPNGIAQKGPPCVTIRKGMQRLGEWMWDCPLNKPLDVGMYAESSAGKVRIDIIDGDEEVFARGFIDIASMAATEQEMNVPLQLADVRSNWFESNAFVRLRIKPVNFGNLGSAKVIQTNQALVVAFELEEKIARMSIDNERGTFYSEAKEEHLAKCFAISRAETLNRGANQLNSFHLQFETQLALAEFFRLEEEGRHAIQIAEATAHVSLFRLRALASEALAVSWQLKRSREAILDSERQFEQERLQRAEVRREGAISPPYRRLMEESDRPEYQMLMKLRAFQRRSPPSRNLASPAPPKQPRDISLSPLARIRVPLDNSDQSKGSYTRNVTSAGQGVTADNSQRLDPKHRSRTVPADLRKSGERDLILPPVAPNSVRALLPRRSEWDTIG